MKITELHIKGFKGLTLDLKKVGQFVRISGRNRAGKTTIIDAIQVATCGRLPSLSPDENAKTTGIMKKLGPKDGYTIQIVTAVDGTENRYVADYNVGDAIEWRNYSGKIPRISQADASAFFKSTGPARVKAIVEAADLSPYTAEFETIEAKALALVEIEEKGGGLFERVEATLKAVTGRQAAIREVVKALGDQVEPDTHKPILDVIEADEVSLSTAQAKFATMQAEARMWAKKDQLGTPPESNQIKAWQKEHDKAAGRIRALEGQNQGLRQKIDQAEAQYAAVRDDIQPDGLTCSHCGAEAIYWKTKREPVTAELARVENARRAEQRERLEGDQTAWHQEIAMNEPELEEQRAKVAEMSEKIKEGERAAKAHKEMMSVIEPKASEADVADCQATIDHFSEKIAQDRAAFDAWTRFDAWEIQHADYQAEIARLRPIAKELRDFSKSLSERVFKSVLAIGNKIAAQAFGIEFEFFNKDLIYWRDGVAVTFDSMSGSERAMATLAVNVGLQLAAGGRIAMIDEFATFDSKAREALTATLNDALESGDLDQVFVIEPTDADLVVDCA